MKKQMRIAAVAAVVCLVMTLSGCFDDGEAGQSQGTEKVTTTEKTTTTTAAADHVLGDYTVEIKGCRLARDYQGKAVAIVTYGFTNNGDKATSFMVALRDQAFQNGVECESAVVMDDSADYDIQNQMKEIKKGASLDVESAYKIDESIKTLEVEVSELISFNGDKVTKTFEL